MTIKMSTWFVYIFGFIIAIVHSQYTDDVDHNDIDIDEDFALYHKSNDNAYDLMTDDDFYIAEESINPKKLISMPREISNSYKITEKIYRYTKHRIPGYDYDEFNFANDKNTLGCDDKSTWTHCLCQFTCYKPNTVDCYTPCNSGCECKEIYVFDEKTQQCVYPKYCQSDYIDNNNNNNIL